MKKNIVIFMALVALIACPGAASALTINLDTEFSNYDPPLSVNFGTVDIDVLGSADGYDDVRFTITYNTTTGTGGPTADLHWFYFNIDPNPTLLSDLTILGSDIIGIAYNGDSGTPTKPDGDGIFDYRLDFGDGGAILQSTMFTVSLANTALNVDDFADGTTNTQSVGGAKGAFTVAAHYQTTNMPNPSDPPNPFTSDFVGGNPSSIPDPCAVFLLGSACLIGFSGARRKFKK